MLAQEAAMAGRSSSDATRSAPRDWAMIALLGAGVVAGCAGATRRAGAGPADDRVATSATSRASAAPTRAALGTIAIAGRAAGPTFRVEVARSEAERARGLMFRSHLAADAGMLFVMGSDADWSFWMRDTFIALDMIFLDADWTVVGVLAAVPPRNDVARTVGKPSRFVLELAAHQASVHGIVTGTKLVFVETPDARRAGEGAER